MSDSGHHAGLQCVRGVCDTPSCWNPRITGEGPPPATPRNSTNNKHITTLNNDNDIYRLRLPDDIARLKSMWDACLRLQHGDLVVGTCVHCSTPGDLECPCCLVVWHRSCCAEIAARTASRTIDRCRLEFPSCSPDMICNLCMSHLVALSLHFNLGVNNASHCKCMLGPKQARKHIAFGVRHVTPQVCASTSP